MFLELIAHIEKEFHRMTQAIKDLTDAVQANTDATNAAVAAILNGSTVDPEDAPAINNAFLTISANTKALNTALGGVVTPTVPPVGTAVTAAQRQALLNK